MKNLTSDKIIFGFKGYSLTRDEIELFKQYPPKGFIIFKRNIESKEQLKQLIANLKALGHNTVILMDQEGGRVARLKPPISKKEYPAVALFGEIYKQDPKKAKKMVSKNYFDLMIELKNFDIDSPCAPVADLHYKHANDVIGDRSFSLDVKSVVDLCKTSIKAITKAGGIAIIKHIPGHGRADVDSHLALPVIVNELRELEQTDFAVFKQLANINDINIDQLWAMTAHVIIKALDDKSPVTTSYKSINYIRNNLGFKGSLISDDICMKALHCHLDLFEGKLYYQSLINAAHLAYKAGCDYILHCSGEFNEMKHLLKSL